MGKKRTREEAQEGSSKLEALFGEALEDQQPATVDDDDMIVETDATGGKKPTEAAEAAKEEKAVPARKEGFPMNTEQMEAMFKKDLSTAKRRKVAAVRGMVVYVGANGKIHRTPAQREARERTTVFVDNLPNDVKNKEVLMHFKKACATGSKDDKDLTVRIRSRAFEHSKDRGLFKTHKLNVLKGKLADEGTCAAYVYVPTEEGYQKALGLDGSLFLDRHIRVEPSSGGAKPFASENSIFIGNLLLELEDEELRKFIVEKGIPDAEKIRIIRDPVTRKGKGFGFVSFGSEESVKKAMKLLRGQYLQGRPLRIVNVKPRSDEKDQRIRDIRSQSAPVPYKEMLKQKKIQRGNSGPNHRRSSSNAVAAAADRTHSWEGDHAKKRLTAELSSLTAQWKAAGDKATASAAGKAKKVAEKARRDERKEKAKKAKQKKKA